MCRKKIKIFFVLLLLLAFAVTNHICFAQPQEEAPVQGEQITISAYYPSPYGIYKEIRLFPNTSPSECNEANQGLMYYDDSPGINMAKICRRTSANNFQWTELGNLSGAESVMYLRALTELSTVPGVIREPAPCPDGWSEIIKQDGNLSPTAGPAGSEIVSNSRYPDYGTEQVIALKQRALFNRVCYRSDERGCRTLYLTRVGSGTGQDCSSENPDISRACCPLGWLQADDQVIAEYDYIAYNLPHIQAGQCPGNKCLVYVRTCYKCDDF